MAKLPAPKKFVYSHVAEKQRMTRDSKSCAAEAPPPTATCPIYFNNHRPPLEFERPNQKRDLDHDESVLTTSLPTRHETWRT